LNASLFEHINRSASVGDVFTLTGFDPKGSIHSLTDDEWVASVEWVVGAHVELLEPEPQTLSPTGRVRFSIGGKIGSGKANALRLLVRIKDE
jgi:hypothetical protein